MTDLTERLWYGRRPLLWPLWPLSWLYQTVASWRRNRLTSSAEPLPVPVVELELLEQPVLDHGLA